MSRLTDLRDLVTRLEEARQLCRTPEEVATLDLLIDCATDAIRAERRRIAVSAVLSGRIKLPGRRGRLVLDTADEDDAA